MKVFISQPMRDKTNEEILKERDRAISRIYEKYHSVDVEILDTFFKDAPHEAKPLWFLGKSLEILSNADLAYFIGDWRNYRGCLMEHMACIKYNIRTMED